MLAYEGSSWIIVIQVNCNLKGNNFEAVFIIYANLFKKYETIWG